jgi:hypothetical protein
VINETKTNEMSTKNTVKVGDREYDLSEVSEVAQLQAQLVPDNWPGNKSDCVRLFLQTADMLGLQFKRHLAHNWLKLCKTAQEAKEEGEAAKVGMSFVFELDQSAPLVAAITKCKSRFSATHTTESKPVTKDITQGEFLADDMSVILDTKSLDREMEEKEKELPKEGDGGEGDGEREPANAEGADGGAGDGNPPDPDAAPAGEAPPAAAAAGEKKGKRKRKKK